MRPRFPARLEFTARNVLPCDVRTAFALITDWPRQTDWVPATVVARPDRSPVGEVGEVFVATTTLGPFVLVDPMEVVARTEPGDERPGLEGRVGIVKHGEVFGGTVEITVRPVAGGALVEWVETIEVHPAGLAGLTRLAGPVPALLGRLAFTGVLRRAARDLPARDLPARDLPGRA